MAKNILICDDAAFMRMMIKDVLSKNGYTVIGEAENGLRAVEKYNPFTGTSFSNYAKGWIEQNINRGIKNG